MDITACNSPDMLAQITPQPKRQISKVTTKASTRQPCYYVSDSSPDMLTQPDSMPNENNNIGFFQHQSESDSSDNEDDMPPSPTPIQSSSDLTSITDQKGGMTLSQIGNELNKIRAETTPFNGLSASDLLSAIAKEGPRLELIPEDDELVLFRSIRKIKSATINRIPKSCTFSFVRTYSSLLEKVIANPQCLDSLFLFYFFPRAVLTKVKTGAVSKCKWKRRQQEARAYQDNIDTWNNGPEGIWSLLLKLLNGKFSSTNAPNQFFNAQKCKDLISEGRFSAAMKILTSQGLAPSSNQTLEALKSKFPQSRKVAPISMERNLDLQTKEAELKKAMRWFPRGSAGGSDGFKPQYYTDILQCPVPSETDRFVTAFTQFINLMLSGSLPGKLAPIIGAAKLIALQKKDNDVRPIFFFTDSIFY